MHFLIDRNFIILIISAYHVNLLVNCLFLVTIPPTFDDRVLPIGQRDGQYIENLGHILKLDTYVGPKQVEKHLTTMTLYNRHMASPKKFVFQPKHYCIPGSCFGPFQFDLVEMRNSNFNPNLKTIVMIPGYLTGDEVSWMSDARDLWLELEDVNIILVTWKNTGRYLYSTAVAGTPLVAREITIFLYYLAELHNRHLTSNYFANRLHFVAHSLGAHIAGFVGQDLGGKLGRITGLDPAGPSFDMMPPSRRLDSSDALLVDIIHTNAGKLHYTNLMAGSLLGTAKNIINKLPLLGRVTDYIGTDYTREGDTAWLGINVNLGHIDYYANNGRVQPGCTDVIHICDHGRSTALLADILHHEIRLEQISLERKSNRLLAFASNNYEEFITGKSFAQRCPSLLDSVRKDSLHDLEMCSIPLDLITPVEDLKSEFRSMYNLDLSSESNGFYFSTRSASPFVDDQFLLKMSSRNWGDWKESCALQVELNMNDGSKLIKEFSGRMLTIEYHAIPFVSSSDRCARSVIDRLTNTSSLGQVEDMVRLLPMEIIFTISSISSKSIIESARKQITKILTCGYACQPSKECKLEVYSLEVIPIIKARQQVIASFGNYLGGDSVSVTSLANRDRIVKQSQGFRLDASNGKKGVIRKLNALMID